MSSPWLEARRLFCERDDRILFSDLNFSLNAGEIVRIAGPNGAGKSTLIRILIGLSAGYEGDLLWKGNSLLKNSLDLYSDLLYLGHQSGIKANLTAEENLAWTCSSVCRKDIFSALDRVGLRGFEDVPAHSLSAGQYRRIALARLYLSPAKLWVLDEPFTAIDKYGVKHLENTLIAHARNGGLVILTTHHDLAVDVKTIDLGAVE